MNSSKQNRIKLLNRFLQSGQWTTQQLHKKVNQELDGEGVTLRAIQEDIKDMRENGAPINTKGRFRFYTKDYNHCPEEISVKEKQIIREALKTLGQFSGLESFEWIQNYLIGEDRRTILNFTTSAVKGSNLLPRLFDAILNKQVLNIKYRPFGGKWKDYIIHPYLLKEYRGRWYLIGGIDSDGFIVNFALDRMGDEFTIKDRIPYRDFEEGDIVDRYKDLVGVTYRKEAKMEHVIIWTDDNTYNYVRTKNITRFQTLLVGVKDKQFREKYPQLEGGRFFDLYTYVCELHGDAEDKKRNYELVRELCSYDSGLVVLEPSYLREQVYKKILAMKDRYSLILNGNEFM